MGELFERALPAVSLEWTGERLTTATAGQIEIEHLHRYFLARSMCRGLDVLDVASGEGYGSALLAQVARSVIGVEISATAVAHAASAYQVPNLRYVEGDARSLPVDDASLDLVVCFETIEHFYEHDTFLAEVRRVLRPGGRLIVSSPDRDVYSPAGSDANPYHVRELSRTEFKQLLHGAFCQVRIFGQRLMLGSVLLTDEDDRPPETLTFEKRGPRHVEVSRGLPRAAYCVAVASDGQIDDAPDSMYIESDEIGSVLDRAGAADAAAAAHAAARAELAQCMQQLESGTSERASVQEALTPLQAELSAFREHFALSIEQVRSSVSQLGPAQSALATLQTESTTLRAELEAARADTVDACRQRDTMRIALRRAVQRSAPRDEFETLRTQLADQVLLGDTLRTQLADQVALTEYWNGRYDGLRARLEAILRRFGIAQAVRVTPAPLRRFVRRRVLGSGRS